MIEGGRAGWSEYTLATMARWIPLAASVLFLPSTALALDAFGGSIRGHGGIVNTGNALHPASGITAPAPIPSTHQ